MHEKEVGFLTAYDTAHYVGILKWDLTNGDTKVEYNTPEYRRLKEKLRVHEVRRVMAGMRP